MRKKVLSIVLAMIMVIAMLPTVAFAADYTDTTGNWAESSIDRWTGEGIVEGNPDGTFAPNNNLKRSEFAQTMTKLMKITDTADLSVYTDVDMDSWYVAALEGVVAKGIMKGTSATTLGPDKNLTREQMFVMIGRALGVEPAATCEKDIPDAETASDWSIGYINALVNMGVIKGVDTAGDVAPLADIQRGQTMAVLDRLIGGYANEDGQTVEIVPDKITLIVADDVKVTGEAGELPIVVAGTAEKVDMEGVEGEATVQVQVSDVAIENAPVGTTVDAGEDAADVTVNGTTVPENGEVTVEPEKAPSTPAPAPAPVVPDPGPSEPEKKGQQYVIVFNAGYGYMSINQDTNTGSTCFGGNNTCFGGNNTCYGGNNGDSASASWIKLYTAEDCVKITLKDLGIANNDPSSTSNTSPFFMNIGDAHKQEKMTEYKQFAGWWHKDANGEYTIVKVDDDLTKLAVNGEITLIAGWRKAASDMDTCYGDENNVVGSDKGTSGAPGLPTSIPR